MDVISNQLASSFCRPKVSADVMTPYGTTEVVDIFYLRNRMGDYSSKLASIVADSYFSITIFARVITYLLL